MIGRQEYTALVRQASPRTNEAKTLFAAFCVGGIICMIGQAVSDVFTEFLPLDEKSIAALTGMTMIFLGALLTGVGVYDKIGYHAGAGSIVPITGFANSIVSPAMEFHSEGIIFGIMARMFGVAGPIIVSGVCSSVVVGAIYYLVGVAV